MKKNQKNFKYYIQDLGTKAVGGYSILCDYSNNAENIIATVPVGVLNLSSYAKLVGARQSDDNMVWFENNIQGQVIIRWLIIYTNK